MSDSPAKNPRKKRGLGRGLDALFSDADAAYAGNDEPKPGADTSGDTAARGLKTLPVEKIQPGKYQPRQEFDDEAIEDLAASIRERGLIQPILVREIDRDRYEIIAGERRWRACQIAPLHDVPVIIKEYDDQEALQVALVENLQRRDLNALEEAEGLQRLIDEFGHRQEDVAKAVGKSRSHVTNTLRLLGLPTEVRDLLRDGKLTAGHARALIGVPDAVVLAQNIAHRGLSVRDTEKLAQAQKSGNQDPTTQAIKKAAGQTKDADILALEHDLSLRLGLKVTIDGKGAKGTVNVNYQSLEQLDEIIRRLT
ncbi:MAG: ParB/RepB/Spo0J family partition protein [Pseudomonadota bacterium]